MLHFSRLLEADQSGNSLSRLDDIHNNCLSAFRDHWQCLEQNNHQMYHCRFPEQIFNHCMFEKLVKSSPSLVPHRPGKAPEPWPPSPQNPPHVNTANTNIEHNRVSKKKFPAPRPTKPPSTSAKSKFSPTAPTATASTTRHWINS